MILEREFSQRIPSMIYSVVFIASSSPTLGAACSVSSGASDASDLSLLIGLVGFVGEVERDCMLPLLGDEA